MGEGETKGGRGWGVKGVCVCVYVVERGKERGRERERQAGRQSKGGWRVLTLLMGKEKGGVKVRAGAGESRGRGVWVVPVLNEEAPESHFHC